MSTIHTLKHGDFIRGAAWVAPFYASVFGSDGYAAERGRDPAVERARCIERGHALVGSIYSGAVLTTSVAFREQEAARYASAVALSEGDLAVIEGAVYRVQFVRGNERGPRNSDPIRFVPVEGWRSVVVSVSTDCLDQASALAGTVFDDNVGDDEVRAAIVAVASGAHAEAMVGGGAAPECIIRRVEG